MIEFERSGVFRTLVTGNTLSQEKRKSETSHIRLIVIYKRGKSKTNTGVRTLFGDCLLKRISSSSHVSLSNFTESPVRSPFV